MRSWPGWGFVVSAGVLWGFPRVPHYHEDLPYIYDLGGLALVALYIGVGFLSFGLYVFVTERLSAGLFQVMRLRPIFIGGGALILAGLLGWLYFILLGISLSMS